MDEYLKILFSSLVCIFSITSILLWYLYGTIDSISYNKQEELKKFEDKISKFSDTYHTDLLLCNMLHTFIAVYFISQFNYGYLYLLLLLILVVYIKHLGYHQGVDAKLFLFNIANIIYQISYPIVFLLSSIIKLISKFFNLDIQKEYSEVTEDEIISLINDGRQQGILEDDEAKMINNIVELGDKQALDIMTHRKNIVAISDDSTLDNVFEAVNTSNYSRFPVYHEELDNIVGILHIRDLLVNIDLNNKNIKLNEIFEFNELIKKPYFVPGTKDVVDIFREMQKNKRHLAIIIDEFGQIDGIVTMEDIIEEIMGNILDEYDVDETQIIEQGNGKFIVKGLCPLILLKDKINVDFGDEHETLSGFLISKLNRIPKDDESKIDIVYDSYNFRIQKVKNKVIQLVKISHLGG